MESSPPDFLIVDGDTLWLTVPIVILGSHVPVAMPGLVRDVSVLDNYDLEKLPIRSVAEALAVMPEVEISQRQQYGTQADISIRGSTYQQVLVLLDGFPISDPQTAHHSLNLPVGTRDVARLEVLSGQGAVLYGTGAFGGTVNVVTRAPTSAAGGEFSVGVGDFASRNGSLILESGSRPLAGAEARTRVGLEYFETRGDQPGTDAENLTVSGRGSLKGSVGELDVLAGYARREFGAQDFYVPFPSFERTETAFIGLRSRHSPTKRIVIEPRLHYRSNKDKFVLLRESPDIYTNNHMTRILDVDNRLSVTLSDVLILASSLEAGYEDIESTGVRGGVRGPALGDHLRRQAALALEFSGTHTKLNWTLGGRLEKLTDLEARFSRSAAMAWHPFGSLTLRSSTGTVYRAPSFTELYYSGPYNTGDSGLRPEQGWAWDAGFDWRLGIWTLSHTYYERSETDLIDWVRARSDTDAAWQAMNIGEAAIRGWSQSIAVQDARGRLLVLNFSRLDKKLDMPETLVSKYALTTFRNLLSARFDLPIGNHLRLSPVLRYRDPLLGDSHLVGDLSINGEWQRVFASMTITNLGDRAYEEVPGVPMPGRMVSLRMGQRF